MRDARAESRSEHLPWERAQRADSAGSAPNPFLPQGASACLDGGIYTTVPGRVPVLPALQLPGRDQNDLDLFGDEECIVGGIGYAAFLADMRGITAGFRCFATLGVDALDGYDTREHALSVMANPRD